jgi:hypothetical protein
MSFLREEFVGKTVISIINNWNKISSCHTHFPERVQGVKRGFFCQRISCRTANNITGRVVNGAYRDVVTRTELVVRHKKWNLQRIKSVGVMRSFLYDMWHKHIKAVILIFYFGLQVKYWSLIYFKRL